jgi:hypothetical protein
VPQITPSQFKPLKVFQIKLHAFEVED